jgi:hypothetical protein
VEEQNRLQPTEKSPRGPYSFCTPTARSRTVTLLRLRHQVIALQSDNRKPVHYKCTQLQHNLKRKERGEKSTLFPFGELARSFRHPPSAAPDRKSGEKTSAASRRSAAGAVHAQTRKSPLFADRKSDYFLLRNPPVLPRGSQGQIESRLR